MTDMIPAGRLGEAEDLAQAGPYPASDDSSTSMASICTSTRDVAELTSSRRRHQCLLF